MGWAPHKVLHLIWPWYSQPLFVLSSEHPVTRLRGESTRTGHCLIAVQCNAYGPVVIQLVTWQIGSGKDPTLLHIFSLYPFSFSLSLSAHVFVPPLENQKSARSQHIVVSVFIFLSGQVWTSRSVLSLFPSRCKFFLVLCHPSYINYFAWLCHVFVQCVHKF